jgi:hypothetical protein
VARALTARGDALKRFAGRLGLIAGIGLWLAAGGLLDLLIVLGIERLQGPVNRLNNYLGRYVDEKARLDAERENTRAARGHRA